MLSSSSNLLLISQYIPHGHCYLWQTPLVWLHILGDGFIGLAYFSIPVLLLYFVKRRSDVPFPKVLVLFSIFILLCGTGHFIDIWTLWHPTYWVSGIEKAMTAIVSLYTVFALIELFPTFLAIQSPQSLERINQQLEQQIAERKQAEAMLEMRVKERTAELEKANATLETEIQERIAAEVNLQNTMEQERTTALVLQRMRQSLNLDEIFGTTAQELRRAMKCDRILIYRFNPDWSGRAIAESVAPGWNPVLPLDPDADSPLETAGDRADCIVKTMDSADILVQDTYLQNSQGGEYRHNSKYYCAVEDINNAGFDDCYLNLLKYLQARAYVIVPIFCQNQLWGLLAAYQNDQPRQWIESEIRVMSRIGSQLGVAAQQAELFAQVQQQSEELRLARDVADRANRAKGVFLATMSHELRTPLNVILGLTQLLQIDTTLHSEHQEYIETISSSGEHLLNLINDVLEISKIEAEQATLNQESFNLYQLLDNLKSMMQVRAMSKGLYLAFELDINLPQFITTDQSKLHQILINLLGNAIKFTDQGQVTLRVFLQPTEIQQTDTFQQKLDSSHLKKTQLCFAIADTGMGIADDEIQSLFQPFYQAQNASKMTEGTGLGLAISQKYAQILGGAITAESVYQRGSIFTLSIQVADNEVFSAADYSNDISVNGAIRVLQKLNQPKVLVVEDHWTNRFLLTKMLERMGLEIFEAENGAIAINLWEKHQPDLIFMDMRMPILDGYAATRQIREMEANLATHNKNIPHVPIIAVTASAFKYQQYSMLQAGCDEVIIKPFKMKQVLSIISQYLAIEYTQEESSLAANQQQTHRSLQKFNELEEDDLSVMSRDWISALDTAASQGNDTWISKLITEISEEHITLAKTLRYLIEEFQFERIIVHTQNLLKSTSSN